MLNLKKQILNYKIKRVLKKYPYVLFIQINNLTPKTWRLIKHKLSQLGITKTLRVKNQVARKILNKADYKKNLSFNQYPICINKDSSVINSLDKSKTHSSSNEKNLFINDIFQGPTLILGCSIIEQLPTIYNIIEENPNLFFIGGLFENQVITHLDFKKITQLDKSIFLTLIQQCNNPINSIFFINSLIDLSFLSSVQKVLLNTLHNHKQTLEVSYDNTK